MDWESDPQVHFLRRLFAEIEEGQQKFLERLGLSPYDQRLRGWREAALNLFEKVWMLSARRGILGEEKDTVRVYLHCLATILERYGFNVPEGLNPANETISELILESIR